MKAKNYKEYLSHISAFIFDVDGVLTDGSMLITSDGDLLRKMNAKDGFAIKAALQKGFSVCIISGGENQGVKQRLENLGITDVYLAVKDKVTVLNSYLQKNGIAAQNALYMGDDIPDIPPMKMVGLPACPADAVPEVKNTARYISHKKGGKGAVRDVIEQTLKVQDKWNIDHKTVSV